MAGNLKGKHGTTAAESITREDYTFYGIFTSQRYNKTSFKAVNIKKNGPHLKYKKF
jgi:hypothetical protein